MIFDSGLLFWGHPVYEWFKYNNITKQRSKPVARAQSAIDRNLRAYRNCPLF